MKIVGGSAIYINFTEPSENGGFGIAFSIFKNNNVPSSGIGGTIYVENYPNSIFSK